jgi:PAS domain S-box-containing protein
MIDFFKSQMDYVYFIYGLGFFTLAAVCFLLIRTHGEKLRWFWLGLFGLVHAINEWLDLFALTLGDSHFFKFFRLIILTVSFLLLFEFGRASFNSIKLKKIPWFVYIFLFILLGVGWYIGDLDGLNMASRTLLGFGGGCFVALVFLLAAWQGEKGLKSWRIVAGFVFAFYALTQLVIAKSHFPIPPLLNQEDFLKFFYFPIQLLRAILAFVASFLLWSYWYLTWEMPKHLASVKRQLNRKKVLFSALVLIGFIVLGWFIVEFFSYFNVLHDKDKFLARAETTAAAVNSRRIEHLTASSLDLDQPDYLRLREQLTLIKKANKDLRFVYLMISKNGHIVFLADSEPEQSPDYSPPGQVYLEAHPLLKRNFFSNNSFIVGPYKDRWGEWISAFSPIKNLETNKNVAVVGMDINYALWQKIVFHDRISGIFVVFSFFIVFVFGFIFVQLSRLAVVRFSEISRFLEHIMDSIPSPVYYKDREGFYLGCNDTFAAFFGKFKKEIIGKTVFDLMPKDIAIKLYEADQALVKLPGVQTIDTRLARADGSTRDVIISKSSFIDAQGDVAGIVGIFMDVTERKKAQVDLLEKEEQFRAIYEGSNDAVMMLDDKKFLDCNPQTLKVFGFNNKEEFIGKSPGDVSPMTQPDGRASALVSQEYIQKAFQEGGARFEWVHQRKNGETFFADVLLSAFSYGGRRVLQATVRDITESKRLLDLIFSEKERLSVTLSSIGDGVIATDTEGKVILMNKAAEVLTGWRQEEAFGQFSLTVFHIINEETRELCRNPFQEVMRTGNVMELENHTVLIAKNGEERIIADSGAPIHDRQGKIIGAVLVFRDITKEKKMLDDLKAAEKEWQRTFDAISDILFIQDKDFNIIKVNHACLEALKLTKDQVVGKKCYEVLHHTNHPWPNCPFDQTRIDQKVHVEEVDDPTLGATLLVTTSPIFKEDRSFFGSIHIAKDISVIKKYQHELEKKNKDLEQLDQLKSDFISIVSHELRTPLAITKEGISLVLDEVTGKINPKQKKILKLSKDSMDRLARLINDLLDISKIESGRVQLLRKSADLVKLVEKVLGNFTLKAREKKLKLTLNTQASEIVLNIDEDRIIQVFVNLIGNALKFTETGSIEVSLDDKGDEVKCVVADTGRGIAKADLPKVFDKFMQFGRTAGGGEKGTGLGLSIAKGLVELHNGKMWVESELGKGTRFCLIVPRKTTMERVREHIEKAIGVAIKDSAEFSLVVAALDYSDKISNELKDVGLMELADQMEKVFRKRIYRQKDSVLNCLNKFFIILSDCNQSNSLIIRDRLAQELEEFLKSKSLSSDVNIQWQIATFPDDGNTYQALIEKVKQD